MQIIISILREVGEFISKRRKEKEIRKIRLEEIWNVLLNEDCWECSSDEMLLFYPAIIFSRNHYRYYVSFDNLLLGSPTHWIVSLYEKGHGAVDFGDEIFRYDIRKRFFNKNCIENRIINFWEERKNKYREIIILRKQEQEREKECHIKELENNFLNRHPKLRLVR